MYIYIHIYRLYPYIISILVYYSIVYIYIHIHHIHSCNIRKSPQVYRVDMEEVLARLRFPQYLEHVLAAYGEKARQLKDGTLGWGVTIET